MGNRKMGISIGAMTLALLILLACTVVLSMPAGSQLAPRGGSDTALAGTAPGDAGAGCMKVDAAGAAPMAANLKGTDLPALRLLYDPYSTFSEVAVDPANDRVVISDINRKSILLYDRSSGGNSSAITPPRSQIIGPDTMVGFVAGVALDLERREIFAVNNDIEDSMAVFSYDQAGDSKPLRALVVPHQSWGISLAHKRDEIAISVQQVDSIFIYRREANGVEPPIRTIQGPHTGLADPHGIYADETHQEIIAANHGNWRNEYTEDRPQRINAVSYREVPPGGRFFPPSITVHPLTASGDIKPLRTIQGSKAGLNYPMAIAVDLEHDEIFVANNGDNSILVFSRSGEGNVAPLRAIHGARTGLEMPIGIAIDPKSDELWVTNSNSHAALVFPRDASGDVAPKRMVRNAPADAPSVGFTNPMALGYDTKRNEILVPN